LTLNLQILTYHFSVFSVEMCNAKHIHMQY